MSFWAPVGRGDSSCASVSIRLLAQSCKETAHRLCGRATGLSRHGLKPAAAEVVEPARTPRFRAEPPHARRPVSVCTSTSDSPSSSYLIRRTAGWRPRNHRASGLRSWRVPALCSGSRTAAGRHRPERVSCGCQHRRRMCQLPALAQPRCDRVALPARRLVTEVDARHRLALLLRDLHQNTAPAPGATCERHGRPMSNERQPFGPAERCVRLPRSGTAFRKTAPAACSQAPQQWPDRQTTCRSAHISRRAGQSVRRCLSTA